MTDPQKAIEDILENVVDYCFGNIWHDYANQIKNPVLENAKKDILALISAQQLTLLRELPNLIKHNEVSGVANPISDLDTISIQDLKLVLDQKIKELDG